MTDQDQSGYVRRLMDTNQLLRDERDEVQRRLAESQLDVLERGKEIDRLRSEVDDLDARSARWAEEHEKRRDELERERSSRQAWAEEAAALKDAAREAYDELGDYIRVLTDVAQPSVAGRRVAAVKAQRIIGGYFGAVMSDWHDAEDRRVCACPTAEQLATLGPGLSPPQCSVHPEPDLDEGPGVLPLCDACSADMEAPMCDACYSGGPGVLPEGGTQ